MVSQIKKGGCVSFQSNDITNRLHTQPEGIRRFSFSLLEASQYRKGYSSLVSLIRIIFSGSRVLFGHE